MITAETNAIIDGIGQAVRILPNYCGDWGDATTVEEFGGEPLPFPKEINLSWWSPTEQKFYYYDVEVDLERAERLWLAQQEVERELDHFIHFVVGMAPFGGIAVWLRGYTKCVLLQQHVATELKLREPLLSKMINEYTGSESIEPLVSREPFLSDMQQYDYRYYPLEEYWDGKDWQQYDDDDLFYDNLNLLSVEDKRSDGTYDLTGDYRQMDYHTTGRPRRFCVRWKEERTDFESHYWMEDTPFTMMWERFFKLHPETKASFLVRIDTRAKHYELALDCEGMDHPMVIPHTSYQQLIFRDNREYFKSENYAQEDGAWRWT